MTWDLLAGTNTVRNLHAVAPLSIQLANDDWTLSFACDTYSRAEADALLLPKANESWVLAQLGGYYTTQQADDAIAAALTNHFTRAEATANLVAFLAQANTYTDDQLLSYSDTAATNQLIADALLTVTLSNGQSWNGGPTFNLLRGTQVLRNLSVAGALTATFQNLDDTILIESDSYARGETYTQAETGAAITAAIDALNLSQYRTEAQVLALIAGELVPYWDQTEVASYVAGELANYQTSSQVSSAISSALSSYDDSSQVDSKIVTALMAIADAVTGGVDLSPYYTSAQTDSLFYPRTELDSLLTATLTQYWTSGRTQTEIDDAIAGAGFQTQADADLRYFMRAPGAESGQIFNLVQEQFTPRIVRNLLLEAPLQGDAILGNQSTLRLRCDSWTKAEADARFLRTNDLGPLDARYFPNTPGAEGGGIFNLVQTQFTPVVIRNLLCQTPLSCQPILGNGSTLQISCDCWSKGQSDGRYPLIANFNSLGQRVTDLENAPGVEPTADLTVNSLTATSFLQTPLLQSAAADLQIQNATTTVRAEDGTLLASFAAGSIGLEQDITVRADRTLNATTADFAQFFVHRGAQRRGHARRDADPGQQRAERAGGAQGARRRRRADEHPVSVHELQHDQRPRQPGDRTEHRREQQRGADLRLRLREFVGQGTQDERPGPLGEGAPGDLRCRGAPDVRPHRGGQGPDRLHRPGGAGHPFGREGVQDQEPGRPGADDARLPEAQRGPLGRGEVPAEANREPREEEARPLLKNGGAGGDAGP